MSHMRRKAAPPTMARTIKTASTLRNTFIRSLAGSRRGVLRQSNSVVIQFDYGESAAVYRLRRALSTPRGEINAGMSAALTDRPSLPPDKTIVLVGLMGAGKSAVGRRLAARLGLRFVDADSEIEAAAGCSIEDIFEFHGEAAFRDCERRVIARLLNDPRHVLATGGGALMDAETRTRVGEKAISVWLRADLEVLLKRVSRRDNRPLLKGKDKREVLQQLIEERHPIYAGADIIVDSHDRPHDEMVDKIVTELAGFKGEGLEPKHQQASDPAP